MDESEAFIEVDALAMEQAGKSSIGIKVEKLQEFEDTDKVLKAFRSGSIVFLNIKKMREKDLGELKRSVDKLKKTIMASNGDIVGVEQDWLILCPEYARVEREG